VVFSLGCSRRHNPIFAPMASIISLGAGTYEGGPISKFKLTKSDFQKIGAQIATLGVPTLFVMKVGYAIAEIGINAVPALQVFEGGQSRAPSFSVRKYPRAARLSDHQLNRAGIF
jgi:acetoin utilization deacetylase AcuC-like enzyme